MIPHPRIDRARNLFRMVYRNQKIDVDASRKTLRDQLDLYLEHLGSHFAVSFAPSVHNKIYSIIERNNEVSKIIDSEEFKKITESKKQLFGDIVVGFVFCIDGRIPTIFLGGRFARHWEVPAGEINVTKRKSDGKSIPEASDLGEALRRMVTADKEVLEIVFAHTSLLNPHHGCGAMAAKRKMGLIGDDVTLEDANLKILKQKTIPAITNLYNDFRKQKGLDPLQTVGIPALYDTDTFGIILNYDLRSNGKDLSTTKLTNEFQEQINDYFIRDNLVFGSFREKFTELKYLIAFSKNLLKVTENLLKNPHFANIQDKINSYIEDHYSHLTLNQKSVLKFFICRSIAFQYLTGLSAVSKKNLDHAFAEHDEEYMAVSIRGATIGKFDPEMQGFSSTPADSTIAIRNIKTKLSIMDVSKERKKEPYILFVCNPVNPQDLIENDASLQRIMANSADLLRNISADAELAKMIERGELIPISILISEHSREVLKIADHSAYI